MYPGKRIIMGGLTSKSFKDGPGRGSYRTSLVYPGGFKIIHPPDVADLIVRELTEQKYTGEVVGIWY